MKIVVVEDEIRIREGISKLLMKLNPDYELDGEAENGREGLELVRKVKPDLVITDIRMPEMDGLEMLTAMYKEKIKTRAIVLSAYSEFEYARKAMGVGVTEYLLKPINVNEFSKALGNVQKQIRQDQLKQPEKMGSVKQIFSGILFGNLKPDQSVKEYMKQKYQIAYDASIILICVYLGDGFEEKPEHVRRELHNVMEEKPDAGYCIVEAEYEKSLLIFIYRYGDAHDMERWLQYRFLKDRGWHQMHLGVGWTVSKDLDCLKESFLALYRCMDWNIALGDEIMISYPKITNIQTVLCTYPVDLENQLKTAICTGDGRKIAHEVEKFHQYFQDGKVYAPHEIKECYVRFLWAAINTAKEVGSLKSKALNQQELLERVMNARTCIELREVSGFLLDQIAVPESEDSGITTLAVKRTISMIQEFYESGITLDEIAAKLDITPEYLSVQFHREVGETFSSYMKHYRMDKAKELLIGTQMKLYEIAGRVGYSDAKYFSRVFRECTGQLPAEYRKTHK